MGPEWHDFFSALAGVTATTFAVLLATLQFTATAWRASVLKRGAAVLALVELFVPLIASLIALMPGQPWRVGYLVTGAAGAVALFWHGWLYVKHEHEADYFDWFQIRVGLPISSFIYGGLLAFSVAPYAWTIYVVAGLGIWLIFSGASEASYLLHVLRPADRAPPR